MNNSEQYDFDTPVERRGTASLKWEKYRSRDIIPMWVADMDFRSPPEVLKAIVKRVEHGVFGYTLPPKKLNNQIVSMLEKAYNWVVDPEWLVWLPSLVTGLNVACRAVGRDGDDIMTAVPVYPPFLTAPGYSRRNLVKVPLKEDEGRWQFDFDRLEKMITGKTRMFILCNPHNPVGRVFKRSELAELAAICNKYDIVICSDEIHSGLILAKDKVHVPTATLAPEIADRTITLMAPSKTFNTPGLGCAFAVISNRKLRKQFKNAMAGIVSMPNALGYAATMAAFSECADWHEALLNYLRANLETVSGAIRQMPSLAIAPVEATYLAWIDMRNSGLSNPVKFFEEAGVGLQDGIEFDGPGFARLNFGCPRKLLRKALDRMKAALDHHNT
ncbi:MAG: PatB family C-S lyase [Desulfobacterales bacterium]|jgi:cystathionine beta-lyase